jgi:DNA-binding GntR family transcriptional regulator
MPAIRKPRSLASAAYDALLAEIARGRWRPGERLVEEELSEELGISRTPLREALQRLEGTGLVEIAPRRGAFLREPSLEWVEELWEVRLLLECHAIRKAAAKPPDESLLRLRDETIDTQLMPEGPEQTDRALELDAALHRLIARRCGNTRLQGMLRQVLYQVHGLLAREYYAESPATETLHERVLIIEALIARDGHAAERHLRRHILNGKMRVVERLGAAVEPAVAG